MLDSIEIKNFKAIRPPDGLTLNNLANVNYLVGKNGCGKSSVLEALHAVWLWKYKPDYCFDNSNGLHGDPYRIALKYQQNLGFISFPQTKPTIGWICNDKAQSFPKDSAIYSIDKVAFIYCYHKDRMYPDDRLCIKTNNFPHSGIPPYHSKYPDIVKFENMHIKDMEELNLFYYGDNVFPEKQLIMDELEKIAPAKIFYINIDNANCGGYNAISDFYNLILHCSQDSKIICIEEPETNLHPEWQKEIPRILKYFIDRFPEIQFIISTHSNYIVSEALKLDNQKVYHIENGQCLNPKGISQLEIGSFNNVLDDIGAKPSDLLFANGVIWVEGPTDIIYIEKWIEMYQLEKFHEIKYKSSLNYQYQIYGGAILKHYTNKTEMGKELTNMLSINTKRFVVFDSDIKNGKDISTFEKYKDIIKKEISNQNLYWYDEEIPTIESYIPDTLRVKSFKKDKYKHAIRNIIKWEAEKTQLLNFKQSLSIYIEKLYKVIESWNL